jgi:hypothetical protein
MLRLERLSELRRKSALAIHACSINPSYELVSSGAISQNALMTPFPEVNVSISCS